MPQPIKRFLLKRQTNHGNNLTRFSINHRRRFLLKIKLQQSFLIRIIAQSSFDFHSGFVPLYSSLKLLTQPVTIRLGQTQQFQEIATFEFLVSIQKIKQSGSLLRRNKNNFIPTVLDYNIIDTLSQTAYLKQWRSARCYLRASFGLFTGRIQIETLFKFTARHQVFARL